MMSLSHLLIEKFYYPDMNYGTGSALVTVCCFFSSFRM